MLLENKEVKVASRTLRTLFLPCEQLKMKDKTWIVLEGETKHILMRRVYILRISLREALELVMEQIFM